jgi:hypothetical protein
MCTRPDFLLTGNDDCNEDDGDDGTDDAHSHLHVLPPAKRIRIDLSQVVAQGSPQARLTTWPSSHDLHPVGNLGLISGGCLSYLAMNLDVLPVPKPC